MSAVVTRSLDDAKAKQSLLAQYIAECERIERFSSLGQTNPYADVPELGEFEVTHSETLEVFERRRDRLLGELTNKGIRIHAESETLKSLAGVIEQNHAKDQT